MGKKQGDTIDAFKTENFSNGYDVVVYNFCLAQNNDYDMIHNMISQTRDNGIPAVSCTAPCVAFAVLPTASAGGTACVTAGQRWAWQLANLGEFPSWWEFTGVDTLKHDWKRGSRLATQFADHPITAILPQEIDTAR